MANPSKALQRQVKQRGAKIKPNGLVGTHNPPKRGPKKGKKK